MVLCEEQKNYVYQYTFFTFSGGINIKYAFSSFVCIVRVTKGEHMSIDEYKSQLIMGIKETIKYVNLHKIKAISSLTIIAMLTTGAYAGNAYYKSNLVDVYHVYLHGAEIGIVDSPRVVEEWIANKKNQESNLFKGYDLEIDTDVTYEHQSIYRGEYDNETTLNVLANSVEVKAKAFRLVVNGEFIGYVKDKAAGERLLESIQSQYTKEFDKKNTVVIASLGDDEEFSPPPVQENEQGEKLKKVTFKEEIEFVPTIIEPTEMTEEETITNILTEGVEEQITYTVQSGDYLGKIAVEYNIPTTELLKLNPGLTEKSILQIGQVLNVTGINSKITVQTVVESKAVESIPFATEVINDNTKFKDQVTTRQKGVKGEKEVTYETLKENGVVVDRTAIDETILTQPIKQIEVRGTKVRPTVKTGKFIWPAKGGYITSNYGYRWGRLHAGIDIAGVKDKTIMASDAGTVTFAGSKASFGNLVIIDHGDGYETYYAHLSSISVKKGAKVGQGQKIGVMGSTGHSTGTHLHFEIRINGKPQNPANAFK